MNKEEIRKEFQLERMVLFSDAVFAIVITLMAIEIHLPEDNAATTDHALAQELFRLLPIIIAYTVSFIFIGLTWYQHLQVFSLLKDYDKGLVVRNLIMLFFIGLFPFSASLMSHPGEAMMLKVCIYFTTIILCKGAQLYLQHYILVKRPNLRIDTDIHDEMISFKKTRLAIIMLVLIFALTSITYFLIPNPQFKNLAWWMFIPFPFLMKYFQKKIGKKKSKS